MANLIGPDLNNISAQLKTFTHRENSDNPVFKSEKPVISGFPKSVSQFFLEVSLIERGGKITLDPNLVWPALE